jgi:hypothetical protein
MEQRLKVLVKSRTLTPFAVTCWIKPRYALLQPYRILFCLLLIANVSLSVSPIMSKLNITQQHFVVVETTAQVTWHAAFIILLKIFIT